MGKRRTEISEKNDDIFKRRETFISVEEIEKEIINSFSIVERKLIFSV